ncbi:MAG: hypothetical protein QOG10_6141, partial [Kribbellaceae bacterium]|nr:hypothetical protein [Kribbellaceae bacterium]
ATWKVTTTRKEGRLTIQPLERLPRASLPAIHTEAAHLLNFLAPGAGSHEIELIPK